MRTLPKRLRTSHQLAIVCSIKPQERQNFELLAKACGLRAHSLVLTDFVDKEELIGLYNLCKLFVLPSWHEGFGLPALEAMSCGRAVIGANTTSLPEVIGREDALFDPHSDTAIAEKMKQVLDNETFRKDLERHGLKQARKFSWEKSAQHALAALQSLHETRDRQHTQHSLPARRPRLAYVSPLPPEPSGISFYSAELLPELSRHYEIDVVVAQDSISDPWILANCPIRQIDDFKENSHTYDRVLYHFGNSEFHRYMFDLIEAIPGAVVLHDFFLSGLLAHLDLMGFAPGSWASALYHAHGYGAVAERFHATDVHAVIWKYPANFAVLRDARGIIVHSEYSRFLACEWYGESAAHDWKVVPHLRVPAIDIDRCAARSALGITESDFVVCSFGLVNPTKLHHRIVDAWLASKLAPRADCKLIFVGENDGGEYGEALMAKIEGARVKGRIRITGWVDVPIFRQYLAAADTSVQLRTNSRGETSGSALDSMNFSCATIVNAHGSLAELSDSCVWKLPENFTDVQLTKALETLWREPPRRREIGTRGRKFIEENQSPRYCADRYAEAIEDFYADIFDRHSLVGIIANLESSRPEISDLRAVATAIAQSLPWQKPARQFLLDISATGRDNLEMQTQSVTRTLVLDLIGVPPVGYRVEPVYLSYEGARCHYRYARNYTMRLLGCPDGTLER